MAGALSNPTQNDENLETYCIIWLDSSANSSDNRQAQQQLQKTIHHLLTFEDEQQCLRYIKNLSKDDRIILIASGRYGRQIVPQIVNLRQIISIYIYCMDKKANDQWAQQFTKIKGVLVRLDELIQQIPKDYIQQQDTKIDESLSIKLFEDQQFLQYQLLIDCLIRMKTSLNDKIELISFCKQYYKNNHSQLKIIHEFEKDYSSERALWWYTRHSFLSRLLNKAFQDENIDLLYLFRFLIHDIGYQLGNNRSSSVIHVYQSQLISKEELHLFQNSIGKFISINSFLSASINHEKTRSLLNSIDFSNDIEKAFFKIEANPQLHNIRPFSNIQSQSYSLKVKEILFMIGSIFRIDRIERDNDKIWNIRLTLCSINDLQLKSILKNKLGNGKINLLQFSHILHQMNKLNYSEKYSRRYFNSIPNNHPDIYNCYHTFGIISELKKNFPSSLKWYKKSLEIIEQTKQFDNPTIIDIYNNIANVYSKTNDYTNAIKSYEKALDISKNIFGENHPRIIKYLNNIGAIYDMKKKYSDALKCYEKALEISKKIKNSDIAITLRNIANVYELQGEFKQALHFYQKALKSYKEFLPSTEVYVNDIETSIRRISLKLK